MGGIQDALANGDRERPVMSRVLAAEELDA